MELIVAEKSYYFHRHRVIMGIQANTLKLKRNDIGPTFRLVVIPAAPYARGMNLHTIGMFVSIPLFVSTLPAGAAHHDQGAVNQHMHRHDFDKLVGHFEDPGRAEWQKPELVLASLGDLAGLTVADIGAGSGYFTFQLSTKAERVLAIDIDQRMLDYIDTKKTEQSIGNNVETRNTLPDAPGLVDGEADVVLIVNTYHHIEMRIDYLRKLARGLAPAGRLVIVDFFKRELPVGPPPHMKLSPDDVLQELETAGFIPAVTDTNSLPYQYLIIATIPQQPSDPQSSGNATNDQDR